MSQITIREQFTIDGALTDVTAIVLSDPTSTFGVKRNDTGAVVVADGTAMTKVSTGVYSYSFDEPAAGLTYTYWVEWQYGGETYRYEGTILGAAGGRLCTLTDVKDRLGIENTDYDTVLSRIIAGLEFMFNTYTQRNLIVTASDITEYYTGSGAYLQLRRYPIVAITSIKSAIDYDFDSADALTADTDYRLINNGLSGIIYRICACWPFTPDATQVVYRGGYTAAGAVPGDGETALPDDIREASIEQACLFFKRKDDLGLSAVSFEGGSIQKFSSMDFLPFVKQTLESYRSISL